MTHRDQYNIIKNILDSSQMHQTKIGYEANLTHPQTVKYLRLLVDLGVLGLMDFKPYPYYEITNKGRRCLQLLGELENMSPQELNNNEFLGVDYNTTSVDGGILIPHSLNLMFQPLMLMLELVLEVELLLQ